MLISIEVGDVGVFSLAHDIGQPSEVQHLGGLEAEQRIVLVEALTLEHLFGQVAQVSRERRWVEALHQRRYRAPEIERLFEAEFVVGGAAEGQC